MELEKVQKLAQELFEKHGLTKWTFEFDNASSRFGVCKKKKHIISLSEKLTLLNSEEQVTDTLLHEIAHALVRTKRHHGKVWKRKAIEIGCRPIRCYDKNVIRPPKKFTKFWIATCPKCGEKFNYYLIAPKRYACKKCCKNFNEGRFSEEFLFTWELEDTLFNKEPKGGE